MSLTSPGVSQWTVNENSLGTQTTQTDNQWSVQHGYSFDSYKSYSIGKNPIRSVSSPCFSFRSQPLTIERHFSYPSGSKLSVGRHIRSRSCPSVRCALCRHRLYGGIKTSESMHYTPRVQFQETKPAAVRGSMPDLRPDLSCDCQRYKTRYKTRQMSASFDSGDYISDEAEDLSRESNDDGLLNRSREITTKSGMRHRSENISAECECAISLYLQLLLLVFIHN